MSSIWIWLPQWTHKHSSNRNMSLQRKELIERYADAKGYKMTFKNQYQHLLRRKIVKWNPNSIPMIYKKGGRYIAYTNRGVYEGQGRINKDGYFVRNGKGAYVSFRNDSRLVVGKFKNGAYVPGYGYDVYFNRRGTARDSETKRPITGFFTNTRIARSSRTSPISAQSMRTVTNRLRTPISNTRRRPTVRSSITQRSNATPRSRLIEMFGAASSIGL